MKKPTCDNLDDYIGGWLSPDEATAFKAHLTTCRDCRQALQTQQQLDRLLEEAGTQLEPVPITLVSALTRNIESAQQRRRLRWTYSGLTAAAVLAMCIVFPKVWQSAKTPETATRIAHRIDQPNRSVNQPGVVEQLALLVTSQASPTRAPMIPWLQTPTLATAALTTSRPIPRQRVRPSEDAAETATTETKIFRGDSPFNGRVILARRTLAERTQSAFEIAKRLEPDES